MYQPHFSYSPDGPSAEEIMYRWCHEHRFLPLTSREPDLAAELIHEFLQDQAKIFEGPPCPTHHVAMALLGTMGMSRIKVMHRLTIAEAIHGSKTGILIKHGIFRCPVPLCFRVAGIYDSGTIGADA